MKKVLGIWCIICCLFTGCLNHSSTDSYSVEESINDGSENGSVSKPIEIRDRFMYNSVNMCETEDTYYGVVAHGNNVWLIMYYDKVSGGNGILCGKPECTHEDLKCNARVSNGILGFSICDEKIYWVGQELTEEGGGQDYLWRMNLDGTQREKMQPIDRRPSGSNVQNPEILIYKNTIFLLYIEKKIESAEANSHVVVYSMEIGSSEGFAKIFDKDGIPDYAKIQVLDDQLYIMMSRGVYNQKEARMEKRELYLYQWDIVNQELKTLLEEEDVSFLANAFWVCEKGIYLSERTFKLDRHYPSLYCYNFETKEIIKCVAGEEGAELGVAGGLSEVAKDIVVTTEVNLETNIMTIYARSFAGELIVSRDVIFSGMEDVFYYIAFLGGDGNSVFFEYTYSDKQAKKYSWIIEIPLDNTLECKVLWYAEREIS